MFIFKLRTWGKAPQIFLFALCLAAAPDGIVAAGGTASPPASPPAKFTVRGQVLNVNGKPAPAGTRVVMMGLARMNMHTYGEALKASHWHFLTDPEGRFVAEFADHASERSTDRIPGMGEYQFVVPPGKGNAGALSERIDFEKIRQKQTQEIVLRMVPGVTVTGAALGPQGNPLPGVRVTIRHDLHMSSHTGYGGEIFERSTVTDETGKYVFQHVYPLEFNIEPKPAKGLVWQRTRLGNGPWRDEARDMAPVRPGQKQVTMDFGLSPQENFVFEGTVTDEAGKPIAGAKVGLGQSFHQQPQTWSDSHSFVDAGTDESGHYRLITQARWIRFIVVRKEGCQESAVYDPRVEAAWENGRPMELKPGRYDFKLKAARP